MVRPTVMNVAFDITATFAERKNCRANIVFGPMLFAKDTQL